MSSWCTPNIKSTIQDSTRFYNWISQNQTDSDALLNLPNLSDEQTTKLNNINNDINNTLRCITEESDSIAILNTQNALTRTDIAKKKKELLTRQEDIKIAQDRALLVRHPELSTSYYDGWFGLNRPMRQLSVPILIGFGVFFMTLSLFILLKIVNINTVFSVLIPRNLEYSRYGSPFGTPFIITAGVAIVLLGLTIYAFTRK